MKRTCALVIALLLAFPTFAVEQSKEQKRLEACGKALKEILDIPDGLPKSLLNKAECVIVIPSVLKFAIGIGGDFGRGAISCRSGQHFTGPWSAPALFALEGGNIGFQLGGQATDLVLLVLNPKGANSILSSKSETWGRCLGCGRTKGACGGSRYGYRDEGRSPQLFPITRIVCGHLTRGVYPSV